VQQKHGHRLYMGSFFSAADLFDDLTEKKIYICGTVIVNRNGMPQYFGCSDLKPECGYI